MSSAPLSGRVCLVTGASRGIGRGIALQLGEAGATVYITGRTMQPRSGDSVGGSLSETAKDIESRGGVCIPVQCDHSKDEDIKALFDRIKSEQNGRLDLLVNNAYAAVTRIFEATGKPFWEQGLDMWDVVNNVGLRNHYQCSVLAAQLMVPHESGLIVNISSAGGLRYLFNVAYGIGKEAVDRMAVDMSIELRKHNVACVSLWPGAVKTELIVDAYQLNEENPSKMNDKKFLAGRRMFEQGESTEYAGKAVVSLLSDPKVMSKSGRVLLTTELGSEYGFKDPQGGELMSMRSLKTIAYASGYTRVAQVLPAFIKVPFWAISMAGHKL